MTGEGPLTVRDFPPQGRFPAATREQWRGLVASVLRKSGVRPADPAAPEHELSSLTADGITVQALHDTPAPAPGLPGLPPHTRGAHPAGHLRSGWDVRQHHRDPDAARLTAAVQADLAGGATSLWLEVGADALAPADLGTVLRAAGAARTPLVLDLRDDEAESASGSLLKTWSGLGLRADELRGNLGLAPLSAAMRTGDLSTIDSRLERSARHAAQYAALHPRLLPITVDSTVVGDAGGSPAQELGVAVAAGTAYLRALTSAGLDVDSAARLLEFRFTLDADQFATAAKLRAARAMWSRVGEVCGVTGAARAMLQHAVTSQAMMTRRDPYVNILRTTIACFAAGVGGADAVTVRPFDAALGTSDMAARRIARNVQHLLLRESGLARVIDPGGGSGHVEHMSLALRDAGWSLFQRIEAAGGFVSALHSGLIAGEVEQTWLRRREEVARRRTAVTGISSYPDPQEPPPPRARARPSLRSGLPVRRLAEDFEALRDRSDAHLAAAGRRPRVFLAALGPLAAHTARTAAAVHLLASGGIEAVQPGDADGAGDFAREFSQAHTSIACLCGSDADYAEHGRAVARALRDAGASRVLIIGASIEDGHGADTVITDTTDVVALLNGLCDELGVAP